MLSEMLSSWYPWAARTLELEHEVISGGIRSYVERLIETALTINLYIHKKILIEFRWQYG
ncbi:MAG: hypothetical protein ABH874_06680 [Methanobacteriota archaeon]